MEVAGKLPQLDRGWIALQLKAWGELSLEQGRVCSRDLFGCLKALGGFAQGLGRVGLQNSTRGRYGYSQYNIQCCRHAREDLHRN